MNFDHMLKAAVLSFRQNETESKLKYLPETRLNHVYVDLTVQLAHLAKRLGWYRFDNFTPAQHQELLKLYVQGLQDFFVLANLKNWNEMILVNSAEIKKFASMKASKHLSKFYLTIQKMLLNSYFFHRQNDFMYSWKLYLKLGLSDLKLTPTELSKAFDDLK